MAATMVERAGLFETIAEPTFAAIAADLTTARVPAGGVVFREGDPPGDFYVIRRGRARVTMLVDGKTLLLAEIEAGSFFGEMSLFEERPRSSSVEAAEDLDLIVMPASAFRALEARDPASASRFYRQLFIEASRRLRRANDVVAEHFRSRLAKLEEERHEKEFMYLLAHDLRSPLAIAEGGLVQLLEKPEKYGALTALQARVLRRSRRSMLFLRQLLDELLEVGRSESGTSRVERTTLADILLEAIPQSLVRADGPTLEGVEDTADFDAVRAALARQGLALEVDPAALRAPLAVDRMRLNQVLMNLVGNALKYAPGAVRVEARRDGADLVVRVVDRGPGIPESYRASIFERYRQAGAKAEGVPRGFGLGLAGARQLVEGLGGTIRAEAGDGGEGTAIEFRIPWRATP